MAFPAFNDLKYGIMENEKNVNDKAAYPDEGSRCREEALYGAIDGLDDYRMDENGLEQMENGLPDDNWNNTDGRHPAK